MAGRRIQRYVAGGLAVTFDPNRCIHTGRCLQRLPAVFDTRRRDWVRPAAGTADDVIETVRGCPSGALQYELEGAGPEAPDAENSFRTVRDGPVYARGDLVLRDGAGGIIAQGTRFALCRCGASANKPFCDNAHRAAGFTAE